MTPASGGAVQKVHCRFNRVRLLSKNDEPPSRGGRGGSRAEAKNIDVTAPGGSRTAAANQERGPKMTRCDSEWLVVRARRAALLVKYAGMLVVVALCASHAHAYPIYDVPASSDDCHSCHPGFSGGGGNSLHANHTANFGITSCNLCHPSGGGSKPVRTYVSGTGGGLGCAGCHGQDFGEVSPNSLLPKSTAYGLRDFHVLKGVTSCGLAGGCHVPGALGHPNPFPIPLGEAIAPTYYSFPNNNLGSPCSSGQEDLPFDADSVGLDNDGDGLVDLADADCIGWVSTTTTTTTSTTTTTLPVQCGAAPAVGCVAAGKSMLFVNEKASGKEKVKVSLKSLTAAVAQGQFGNPLSEGGTNYAVCIYDDANQLVGELSVSRSGDNCSSPPVPCYKASSDKGYKYGDKLAAADGVFKKILLGGDAGKGKVNVNGKNDAAKGLNDLPIGIAALLQSNTQATVQVLTSDASCFTGTVTQVKTADGVQFKATAP